MDILSKNAEPAGVTTAGKNTEEGARTLDLWIHNPVLYQLSYLGIGHKPKHSILRHPNSEAKTSQRALGIKKKPYILADRLRSRDGGFDLDLEAFIESRD
jgi:hypothetical protein